MEVAGASLCVLHDLGGEGGGVEHDDSAACDRQELLDNGAEALVAGDVDDVKSGGALFVLEVFLFVSACVCA